MLYLLKIILIQIVCHAASSQYLDSVPVLFQLKGSTTYTADIGGLAQEGYKIYVAYSKYEWLGIKFITNSNPDVLIIQRDSMSSLFGGGVSGFKVSVTDYFNLQGTDRLMADTLTNSDVTIYQYPNTNDFSIEFIRTVKSNAGEDWDASSNRYSMLQVCFFTGEGSFSKTSWKGSYESCYGYEIKNLESTYRGVYMSSIQLNGVSTPVYGGITDSLVSNNLFLYHKVNLGTYSQIPSIVLQLDYVSQTIGFDYQIFSTTTGQNGDYFGASLGTATRDISYHGFEDFGITVNAINVPSQTISEVNASILGIGYNRLVYTGDVYDKNGSSIFAFCIRLFNGGSYKGNETSKACSAVIFPELFPRITVESALQLGSARLHAFFYFCLLLVGAWLL